MGWLCGLLGALAVVTLVGHGIWVLIATLLRGGTARPPGRPDPFDELVRTELQINRLAHAGLLDEATRQRVIGAIVAARERSVAPRPTPVLPLAPVAKDAVKEAVVPPPLPAASLLTPSEKRPVEQPPVAVQSREPVLRPIPPRKPSRPFSQVVASFMRESNIRWGELIGGLLIVGCSIALVVSFWNRIRGHAFFEFGIFTSVTTALMGLGLYAEHRWKLPTTSRGILLIATLLVPLNFVAFAALSHGAPASVLVSGFEVAALALFGFLAWRAAQILVPYWPRLLCAGVAGLSAALVLIQHLGPAHSVPGFLALAGLPAAVYLGSTGTMLAKARRWRHIHGHVADAMFLVLGVLTFGAVLGMALVVFPTDAPFHAAHQLSPLLSLGMAPVLATGLMLWRRVSGRKLAGVRTAGTAIAMAAAFLILGTIALAWPDPQSIVPLAALDFAALTAVAVLFEFPALHAFAGLCLMIAWLVGYHIFAHHVRWTATPDRMWSVLSSPAGGAALMPLFALSAGAAFVLNNRKRALEGRIYGVMAVAVAAVSLLLATWGGFARPGDPFGVTWVYLGYAIAAVLVVWRLRRPAAAWAAWVLLLAAAIQFFASRESSTAGWVNGLLAYATFALGVCLLARGIASDWLAVLAGPARRLAALICAAATVLLIANTSIATAGAVWPRLAWAAGLWMAIAILAESAGLFAVGQVVLAGAAGVMALANVASRTWFRQAQAPMVEPWTLQAAGLAVGALGLAWAVLRQVLPRKLIVRAWLESVWSADRVISLAILIGLALLSVYAVIPGINFEFAAQAIATTAPSFARAAGSGSWAVLLIVSITLGLWLRDRTGPIALLLMVFSGAIACTLWAARWNDVTASASALRWALSGYLMLVCAPLWVRDELPLAGDRYAGAACNARTLAFALVALPVLLLSLYPAAQTLGGLRMAGPLSACFFGRIGNATSYCVPLVLVAAACVGNAARDRSPGWAFLGSVVLNLTATLGYGLAVATAGERFEAVHVIRLVQINTITLAAFALAWQAMRALRERQMIPAARAPLYLTAQLVAAVAGNLLLILPAAILLSVAPTMAQRELAAIGSPLGWSALAMALGAVFWARGARIERVGLGAIAMALAAASLMLAYSAAHWDAGDWRAYHVLIAAMSASAGAMLGLAAIWSRRRAGNAVPLPSEGSAGEAPTSESAVLLQYQRNDQVTGRPLVSRIFLGEHELYSSLLRCLAAFSGVAVLLALRAMAGDPQRPWWSAGATLAISILWTMLAWWMTAPRFLYAGGLLLNLAATMWWIERPWVISAAPLVDLLMANVTVLAFSGLAAMVLELQVFATHNELVNQRRLPFHRFAAIVSTAVVFTVGGFTIVGDALGVSPHASGLMTWAAVGATVALAGAMLLWDERAKFAAVEHYVMGLAGIAFAIDALALPVHRIGWALAIALAGYVVLTAFIWEFGCIIRGLVVRSAGTDDDRPRSGAAWLATANLVLAAIVIVLSLWIDFTFVERGMRVAAASAAVVQVAGLLLAAKASRRADAYQAALWIGAIAAAAWGWAWMTPGAGDFLDRSVVLLGSVVATTLLYQVVGRWMAVESLASLATRRMAAPMATVCAAAMAEVLGAEAAARITSGAVVMSPVAILFVIVALLGAVVASLILALRPAIDPLRLPDSRRGLYVYAAEGLLALAFVHLRLTVPQLFGGLLAQCWPMIVMAIAFVGVGLAEVFRRRQLIVLSDPLFRTGVFLPILPAIAYWLLPPSRVDYAYLLFTAGLLYAILSMTRKSFALGVLAALAGNGGLWSLLAHAPQLGFLVHPQLWMVPAAISVLIAAQLNADRLSAPNLRAIRYACLSIVYVSSTADVFLNGVSRAPWLPLVLAALSVMGVMLGILFRMRAFLVLGTAFLSLAIVTMIYYASANLGWTWLWYVAGIALGSAIIATFALFEKKRTEMLALVEGLKRWQ